MCLTLFALASGGCNSSGGDSHPSTAAKSTDLTLQEVTATSGAAPGYVDDKLCAKCHADLYESYQQVGMARTFFQPGDQPAIEDFEQSIEPHEKSHRHYEMSNRDGKYVFKRFQLDENGQPINVFRRQVDWVLGSGNHARVYLYQTDAGELYQLPLAWYTQENRWGMAPGYHKSQHDGVSRQVRRECMFCHNAYPDVPEGSDRYGAAHAFPATLPRGIGCQRCHGPGEAHVRAAIENQDSDDKQGVVSSIVNPGRLDAALGDDVCNACHLQPSAELAQVRKFGRGDYSFQPGQTLSDYLVQFDAVETGRAREDRFEINHHAYRLTQSRCFKQTEGGIRCTACHDPHRHVPPEDRIAHYSAACAKCHAQGDCTVPPTSLRNTQADDCVACHMPRRRTQDFVHVAMTDHLIQRRPSGDLLATLEESEPAIEDVVFLNPSAAPKGPAAEIYRAIAVLRSDKWRNDPALDKLARLLAENDVNHVEPYLDLAEAQINARRFEDAQTTLKKIAAKQPDHPLLGDWLGVCLNGLGNPDAAIEQLKDALAKHPDRAESQYYLALIYFNTQNYADAVPHLKKTVEARPSMARAWYYLGKCYAETDRLDDAITCYRQALQIEPALGSAYGELRQALLDTGQSAEAMRYWNLAEKLSAAARSGDNTSTQPASPPGGPLQPLPIPSPPLTGLEPALADQISWGQQLIENTFKYKAPLSEVAAAFGALGQLYHANDLAGFAEACYTQAAELAPDDYRWPHLLGVLYERGGEPEKAAAARAKAHELNADYDAENDPLAKGLDKKAQAERIYLACGLFAINVQRFDVADRVLRKAIETNPDSVQAHVNLGTALVKLNENTEAIKVYEIALRLDPDNFPAHYNLGLILFRTDEFKRAVEHFEAAVKLRPESAEAKQWLDKTVEKIGDDK